MTQLRHERLRFSGWLDDGRWRTSFLRDGSRSWLLPVRTLNASAMVGVLAWSVSDGPGVRWLVFLTNWSLLLVTVYTCVALAATLCTVPKEEVDAPDPAPRLVVTAWAVQSVALPVSIAVVGLYWVAVAPLTWPDIPAVAPFAHGLNAIVMLSDFMLSAMPHFPARALYMLAYGGTYMAFSFVYFRAMGCDAHACDLDGRGHPYIYAVLDWSTPRKALVVAVLAQAIPVPLLNALLYALSKWKGDDHRDHRAKPTVGPTRRATRRAARIPYRNR